MKESKKTKLSLKKITIKNLSFLSKKELQAMKGGTGNTQAGITNRPIYC
jgi:hypothetical protein